MKAKLVRIGNSRGVRLPKPLIEEAGLPDEVELKVRKGAIIISPANDARSGWEEAARTLSQRGEDQLIDAPSSTHFADEEWKW
jgi:antitoxin MazE